LLGIAAIAAVTWICFRLRLTLPAPLCLDLIVIVVLSLRGSFLTSAIVSIVAVGCIDYYFTKPLFSALIFDPIDLLAVSLFLMTSAVITALVSRLRARAEELSAANALLEEQMAEVRLAQDQVNLARMNRIVLMGEMAASIAHEVNQPLTGILANAGTGLRYLGRDVPDLEEARRCLELIVRDGRRAADVILRVRTLAKRTPPSASRIDVNETILDVIALAKRELESKNVELGTELARSLPELTADRVQLQQVLLNLILNATEALSESNGGPRELTVVSGATGADAVFVEVRDSGPGFAAASADCLFASFYTTKPEGMGMGLSISRSIVEAHGGRLTAEPNEPRGAVFRFTLPVGREKVVDD